MSQLRFILEVMAGVSGVDLQFLLISAGFHIDTGGNLPLKAVSEGNILPLEALHLMSETQIHWHHTLSNVLPNQYKEGFRETLVHSLLSLQHPTPSHPQFNT